MLWARLGIALAGFLSFAPTMVVLSQAILFQHAYPQPLVYDAGQYWALSQQVEWVGPMPMLRGEGLRTYAYPAFVSLLARGFDCQWVHVAQITILVLLLASLRWSILPKNPRADLLLALVLSAFPVLVPYSLVLLADLLGAVALVGSFLLLARSMENRSGMWAFGLGFGLLAGIAVQLRPAYLSIPLLVLIAALAMRVAHHRLERARGIVHVLGLATCGFLLASLPTMVANWERGSGIEIVPREGTKQIVGYHLMLGLSMDRWSSNPPPFAEREEVARQWLARGWSIAPLPGLPSPRVEDFWNEVLADPMRAARQAIDHVVCAFDKRELFPYVGDWPSGWQGVMRIVNALVLIVGVVEATRQARSSSMFARTLALLHLTFLAALVATCALIVPEERFTLAAYPLSLVYSASFVDRWMDRIGLHAP